MNQTWILDTSPLIFLARIDQLSLLSHFATRIIIPVQVAEEVLSEPARTWLMANSGYIEKVTILTEVKPWRLGNGESAAISRALLQPGCVLLVDDLPARRCAEHFGLKVRGIMGVLAMAKREGKIVRLKPVLRELTDAGFRASTALIQRTLEEAGE